MNQPQLIHDLHKKIKYIEQSNNATVGIYAFDTRNPHKVIKYNANACFPSASSVKLLVAFAVMKISEGNHNRTCVHVAEEDIVRGNGVLAHIGLRTHSLSDMLYFLLAHSDNTAQRALERHFSTENITSCINTLSLPHTNYVPLCDTTEKKRSTTSPTDMAHFLCDLHSGKLLMATQTEAILATMAKNTTTYFGLRALPCALNTTAPTILAHYTKSGKLRDLVCDNCILTHATGTTYISIFIQNYLTNTYGNNVDNAAILSLSELSRDTHVLMQKINNNK